MLHCMLHRTRAEHTARADGTSVVCRMMHVALYAALYVASHPRGTARADGTSFRRPTAHNGTGQLSTASGHRVAVRYLSATASRRTDLRRQVDRMHPVAPRVRRLHAHPVCVCVCRPGGSLWVCVFLRVYVRARSHRFLRARVRVRRCACHVVRHQSCKGLSAPSHGHPRRPSHRGTDHRFPHEELLDDVRVAVHDAAPTRSLRVQDTAPTRSLRSSAAPDAIAGITALRSATLPLQRSFSSSGSYCLGRGAQRIASQPDAAVGFDTHA